MIKKSVFKLLVNSCQRGELNLLILSLVLSVATVTCISIFTDRIKNSMLNESAALMAADAHIQGSMTFPEEWKQELSAKDVRFIQTVSFRAMSFAKDAQMTSVKAVPDDFPLKGELLVSDKPFGESSTLKHGPQKGEAWINSRLFQALGIQMGDRIEVGQASFIVSKALVQEPGSTQSFFSIAPRVMINLSDVEQTKAIRPGSRIEHSLLLAGEQKNIQKFKEWVLPKLSYHFRWISLENSNRGVSSALDKAQQFFLLAGCLGVILSGAAISLSATRYARSLNTSVALLKTFGMTPTLIFNNFILALLTIGLICVLIGSFAGWALHWILIAAMADLIPVELSASDYSAYTVGAWTGLISLFAFAVPPIAELRKVSPVKILKSDLNSTSSIATQFIVGLCAVGLLLFLYSQSLKLTFIISASALLCFIGVTLLLRFFLRMLVSLSKHFNHTWRLGITSLYRHRNFNGVQGSVFSVLLMLLFILVLARTSLINQWQNQLPENAPNHFLFNVFHNEKEHIDKYLENNDIDAQVFYPMSSGKVIKINGIAISERLKNNDSNVNYKRELNLSWADSPTNDNKIISGKWWTKDDSATLLVSAEQSYAEGIQLAIGDTLTYSVAGQEFEAILSSIRSVQWDSMNPNFYMLFNKPFLEGKSANWLTSFHIPQEKKLIINDLLKAYPSVTIIEIDQTIKQIQSIMNKVSMAVEFILLLVLISGLLLLITCIQATLDIRKQESAVIRALGGAKELIRKRLLIEFGVLGLIAGFIGLIGAEISLYYLAKKIFDLEFVLHLHLWWSGPLIGALLIGITGWLSVKSVINISPLKVLRQ